MVEKIFLFLCLVEEKNFSRCPTVYFIVVSSYSRVVVRDQTRYDSLR